MAHGFVYVLSNMTMPGIYKIGRTSGSPAARAQSLSSATGVPFPFSVVCYAEMSNFEAAESEIHHLLRRCRVNNGREFFRARISEIVEILNVSRHRITFCDVEIAVAEWDEGNSLNKEKNVVCLGGLE